MHKPIYAAGYYPLAHDPSDWERDLKNMKDAGISLIRTAEIFCGWDQIEPEQGKFEFDWLDKFFDLCGEYDMRILLGTGTATPPYWLHERYNDVNIVDNTGKSYPNNVSYSWACLNHPGYRENAENYINTIVGRYKNHPALYAYQIHNEIGFPFMPHAGGSMSVYCYCKHCKAKYKKWLSSRYNHDIEKLNHAYSWNATHTRYQNFDQVEPPEASPSAWSSLTRWIDWRTFWMEDVADFVKWQNDIIKQSDKEHLTSTNTFFMKSQDPFGVLMGLDPFRIAENVDVIGFDIYPGSGNKADRKPEFSSMCLDMSRSAANSCNKDYWMLETESGPINGWVMGPDRNVTGSDLWRNNFDAIGHGCKLNLYQGFREWDYQPIHWGGLVDLDGNPTRRYYDAVKIGETLHKIEETVQSGRAQKSAAAIMISRENAIIMQGIGQENFLVNAVSGAYKAFWNNEIPVDFITPQLIAQGKAEDYKLIYTPLMAQVTKETAEKLARFVYNGGTLLGSARLGMLGEKGWLNHQIPCFSLSDAFGISSFEATAGSDPIVRYNGELYCGSWHREYIEPLCDEVNVLAEFEDGGAAVTSHSYGEGKAIYIGTHSDMALWENKSDLLEKILAHIAEENDLYGALRTGGALRKNGFDFHLVESDSQTALIAVALPARSAKGADSEIIPVSVKVMHNVSSVSDLVTGRELTFSYDENGFLTLNVELYKDRASVILFK